MLKILTPFCDSWNDFNHDFHLKFTIKPSVTSATVYFKGEVSPNNNVDWVSRKQFYKPNSKSLSRFG